MKATEVMKALGPMENRAYWRRLQPRAGSVLLQIIYPFHSARLLGTRLIPEETPIYLLGHRSAAGGQKRPN